MYRDSRHGLTIDLSTEDGNAMALMAYANRYARDLDKDGDAIIKEMTRGDYQNVVAIFEREFGSVITLINKGEQE